MSSEKKGFVALWHNIPADIDEEYNLVHTREHLPDYVANATGPQGMEYGRRYGEGEGQLPRYFAFYPVHDIHAIAELSRKPWPEHPVVLRRGLMQS